MYVSYTGGQIMSIAYGYTITENDDTHLRRAEELLDIVANRILGPAGNVWLVDVRPSRTRACRRQNA